MSSKQDLSERFRRWREYGYELETLHQDDLLRQQGYRLCYGVDFSEIFRYAHPIVTEPEVGLSETEESASHRERMALSFLFNQYGSLLVPDPYIVELEDHIRYFEALAAFYDLYKYNAHLQGVATVINPLEEGVDSHIRVILRRLEERQKLSPGERQKLSPDDRKELVEFIANRYALLWAVQQARSAAKGIEKLQARWREGAFVSLYNHPPSELPDKAFLRSSELLRAAAQDFRPIFTRRRERGASANFMDSIACQTVRQINEVLVPKKVIFILISNDRLMRELGNNELSVKIPGFPRPCACVRGLGYVRAQIYAAKPSTVDHQTQIVTVDPTRLLHHLHLQSELIRVMNGLGLTSDASSLDDVEISPELEAMIDQTWDEIGRYLNVRSFFTSNQKIIKEIEADISEVSQRDAKILTFLKGDPQFEKAAGDEMRELFEVARIAVHEFAEHADETRDGYQIMRDRIQNRSPIPIVHTEPFDYVRFFLNSLEDYQSSLIDRLLKTKSLNPDTDRAALDCLVEAGADARAKATQSLLLVIFNHIEPALESNREALEINDTPSALRTLLLVMRSSLHRVTSEPLFEASLAKTFEHMEQEEELDAYPLVLRERALLRWTRAYANQGYRGVTKDVLGRSIYDLQSAMALLPKEFVAVHRRMAADLMLLLCWRNNAGDLQMAEALLGDLRMPASERAARRLPPMFLIADATLRIRWWERDSEPEQAAEAHTRLNWAADNYWLRAWKRRLVEDLRGWLGT